MYGNVYILNGTEYNVQIISFVYDHYMLRINKLQKQRYHALWKDANLNVKKTVRMPIIDLNILNLIDGRPILTYKTLTI